MQTTDAQKKRLRERLIAQRNAVTDKQKKSERIFFALTADDTFRQAEIIALYKSLPSEVDTAAIITFALNAGKTVALPRTDSDGLRFYRIASAGAPLEKSRFGVQEPPQDETARVAKDAIDLVIVPGVGFDLAKNRIGFGKGYYDRFLQGASLRTIALCFEEQVLKDQRLPAEPTDVSVQKIITDQRVY